MNIYETDLTGYEPINDKYRYNKATGKVINKNNRFVKVNIEPKKRDFAYVKDIQRKTRKVEATNMTTNDVTIYRSIYACSKDIKVNPGMIKLCCDGNFKKVISKDNTPYMVKYTTEEPTKEVTRELTIYNSKEERKQADLERAKRNNRKKMICECGVEHTLGGKTQHLRSKRHADYIKNNEEL